MATTAAPTPFAHELQALKAELQRTLSRLSTTPTHAPASPWSQASATTTATTPTTVRSVSTSGRSQASPPQSDVAARILEELVATARRRRQAEMHMARELERELLARDETPTLPSRGPAALGRDVVDDKEQAIRSEIDTLRQRRKQILNEIDVESKADDQESRLKPKPMRSAPDANVANRSAVMQPQHENEYSIEGIVKLGPLTIAQPARRDPTPRPASTSTHQVHHLAQYPTYRAPHHDMMQDVFAIQLKFAETMLQLEKSLQVRDQLLVPTSTDRPRRRRTGGPVRRRVRPPSTIYEDRERDATDSSEDMDALSTDDATMSETTMRLWRRYRVDRPRSAGSPGTARSSPSTGDSVATTTTSTSPHSQPSPEAPMPMDEHLVTPTTHDSGKQVRFHEAEATDDYPTPLIARNISFDQASIDSTDDEHPRPTTRRRPLAPPSPVDDDEAQSFMDEPSVCSADLNDESFLAAFYALRSELSGKLIVPPTKQSELPETPVVSSVETTVDVENGSLKAVTVDFTRQKRSLTLDIQALTAKLVLASNAREREGASAALDALRQQLQVIEAQEAAAVA